MKVITYSRDEIQSMKPSLYEFLDQVKAENPESFQDFEGEPQYPYGKEEIEEVDWAVQFKDGDKEGCILFYHTGDGLERHDRCIHFPMDDLANPYIQSGNTTWSGDDEDYMGNIAYWIMSLPIMEGR